MWHSICSFSKDIHEAYFRIVGICVLIMVEKCILKPAHDILVYIALSSKEGSSEPSQILARAFAARVHKVWMEIKNSDQNLDLAQIEKSAWTSKGGFCVNAISVSYCMVVRMYGRVVHEL